MEKLTKRVSALLSVKSIVTILLTGVFCYLAIVDKMSQDVMTIYAVIISFYFGTQHEKLSGEGAGA